MAHIAPKLYSQIPFLYDSKEHIVKLYGDSHVLDKQMTLPISQYDNFISSNTIVSRNSIIKSITSQPTQLTLPAQSIPAQVQPVQADDHESDDDNDDNSDSDSDGSVSIDGQMGGQMGTSIDTSIDGQMGGASISDKKENPEQVIYDNLRNPLSQYRIEKLFQHINYVKFLADKLYEVVKLNPSFPSLNNRQKYNYLLTVISQGREFYFTCMCDYTLPLYLLDEIDNYYDILDAKLMLNWQ